MKEQQRPRPCSTHVPDMLEASVGGVGQGRPTGVEVKEVTGARSWGRAVHGDDFASAFLSG